MMNDAIRAVMLGATLAIASALWTAPLRADDAPPPPPLPSPLEALFEPVREQLRSLTPFIGDTDLRFVTVELLD